MSFDPKLDSQEVESFYTLVEELTGTCQRGTFRKEVLLSNVLRRLRDRSCKGLEDYLKLIQSDSAEYAEFISAITIHTTSWFREAPHFESLENYVKERIKKDSGFTLRVWSAACSSGEEVYSIGMCLESLRKKISGWDYQILGTDIDPLSIKRARAAVYARAAHQQIPPQFKEFTLIGSGEISDWFAISKEIRSRVRFEVADLNNELFSKGLSLDIIFCRNVLIYFSKEGLDSILKRFTAALKTGGILCLGHSEMIEAGSYGLDTSTSAWFCKREKRIPLSVAPNSSNTKGGESVPVGKGTVLIIDDSATVRMRLRTLLTAQGWRTQLAAGADEADVILKRETPQLITLDLHMPGKDGSVWLKERRSQGLRVPVIIITESETQDAAEVMGALRDGAQEYVLKQRLSSAPHEIADLCNSLASKYRQGSLSAAISSKSVEKGQDFYINREPPDLIAIGASTGGPEALWKLLEKLPEHCPPLLVVQHIHPTFARAFAERVATVSGLKLGPAVEGEVLKPGHVYIATSDFHIGVAAGRLKVSTEKHPSKHQPSVDFLFESVAASRAKSLSIILTGMGRDGASGMKAVRDRGLSLTLGQDEESCIVYGMPKVAFEEGAVEFQGDIPTLRRIIDAAIVARGLRNPKKSA